MKLLYDRRRVQHVTKSKLCSNSGGLVKNRRDPKELILALLKRSKSLMGSSKKGKAQKQAITNYLPRCVFWIVVDYIEMDFGQVADNCP